MKRALQIVLARRPGTMLGYPACVYGFFMYLAVVAVAAIGMRKKKTNDRAPASELAHST